MISEEERVSNCRHEVNDVDNFSYLRKTTRTYDK